MDTLLQFIRHDIRALNNDPDFLLDVDRHHPFHVSCLIIPDCISLYFYYAVLGHEARYLWNVRKINDFVSV